MFGYACDETSSLMPLPIYLAHRLVERQAMLRKDGRLCLGIAPTPNLSPFVTLMANRTLSIQLSYQRNTHQILAFEDLREATIEEIIKPVIPKELIKR